MKIQDLEKRTELERPTIRFYEKEGLINPKRLDNGYREYSEQDAAQLMKIKLLRQLGLSLERIKELQQGRADFSDALTEQVRILNNQIDGYRRAREVCQVMRTDGIDYQSMDAERYLRLLRELPIENHEIEKIHFQERVPREIHPGRRFVARMVDLTLFGATLQFILYVVIRLRPLPSEFLSGVMHVLFGLLFIPLEAGMLHIWGTTPGKWAMGIRLEYIQGGKLSFSSAINRSWHVFRTGMGFCIPVWQTISNLICYCRMTGRSMYRFVRHDEVQLPDEMDWDSETEILYSNWGIKGKWYLASMVAAVLVLQMLISFDGLQPKYRGPNLTIAQFAANYNSYVSVLEDNAVTYDRMLPDGTWEPDAENTAVIYLGGEPKNKEDSFIYETENGFIRTVSYESSWTEVFYITPMEGQCLNIAISTLLAQDWFAYRDLRDFTVLWDENMKETEGCFRYENLEVIWSCVFEDCIFQRGAFYAEEGKNGILDFSFQLVIHDT